VRCFQTACQIDPSLEAAHAALARMQQGGVQVAARPTMQSVLVPASQVPSAPPAFDTQTVGPSFPVPRSLPPVQ
jgi:hypothetical protein